jgi:hypothetical protein
LQLFSYTTAEKANCSCRKQKKIRRCHLVFRRIPLKKNKGIKATQFTKSAMPFLKLKLSGISNITASARSNVIPHGHFAGGGAGKKGQVNYRFHKIKICQECSFVPGVS